MKSFRTKLFLIIAGLMIIALASFTFTFYKVAVDSLLEENLKEMKAFAIIISEYLGNHLLSDKNDLQEAIQFIWRNSKAVHSFTIFDYTTNILASTFESDVGTRTRQEDHQQVLKDGKLKFEIYKERDGGTFATIVAPILTRDKTIAGGLEIVYQLEEFDRTVSNIRKILAILFIVFLVLSLLTTIFISHLITKPLLHLKAGFSEVSKGNLEIRLSAKRNDEFGEVINTFNKMTSDLKRSTEELKATEMELRKYKAHLEKKVEERTVELERANEQLQIELTERKRAEDALQKTVEDLEFKSGELENAYIKIETDRNDLVEARYAAEQANRLKSEFLADRKSVV